jgi:hypothetical protein
VLNLRRDETAVLCLLLLRGPQTPGELRSRADRLYSFDDLEAVQVTLERLAARVGAGDGAASGAVSTGPLAVMLPRQPGSRESRYAQLLGGPVEAEAALPMRRAGDAAGGLAARVAELEAEVARLRAVVEGLEARLGEAGR